MRQLSTLLTLLTGWCLLLLPPGAAHAQAVTTTPSFFRETDAVVITYDATKGNAALQGTTGDVYIYTGVVTSASTSTTTWRHVTSPSFSQPDPNCRMTRSSTNPNIYTITITPRNFYTGVPAGDVILRLAMLFRNGTGTTVGRTETGGDFFIDVWQGGLALRVTEPANVSSDPRSNPMFVNANSTLNVSAISSLPAALTISVGATQVAQNTGTGITTSINTGTGGRQVVRILAQAGTEVKRDSFAIIVRPAVTVAALPAAVPAGLEDGVTYLSPTSAILVLTAPQKQFVYALGEWNGFQADAPYYMNQTPDGNRWWVQIDNLTPGQEYAYQYLVDGNLRIADPYAAKILDPNSDRTIPAANYPGLRPYPTALTAGIVSVLQTNQPTYTWQTTGYQRPKETDLVVYEMLVRDFVALRNYQTISDTLDYLQRLGVTAIELMPVNEFENNDSWGYNGSFHLALDKYYGTPTAYKQFVDACHSRGIAVIMDIALNHAFGQNTMVQMYWDAANSRPATNSPWFNPIAKHDFNVGYDFNHESAFTKYYSKRVMRYWLDEYHVDGYRFDLSKGFTQRNTLGNTGAWGQYDQTRVDIWEDYADHIWSVDSTAYVILEHFADNTEERVLANYHRGMMPWGNASFDAADIVKGTNVSRDLSYNVSWKNRGWNRPRLVSFMESHDEERMTYSALTAGNQAQAANGYDVRTLPVALARDAALATFFMAVPGPKMLWQFGEVGYDVSINQNGRTGAKPVRWQYYQDANRRRLYNTYAAMFALRKHPAFESVNFDFVSPGSSLKTLRINDPTMNVLVVANYSLVSRSGTPQFQSSGRWYNYLTGDSIDVQTSALPSLQFSPGECRVYTTVRQPLPAGIVLGLKEELVIAQTGLSAPQAFPNPADAAAPVTLAYELARPATVQAIVFDVLGREVRRTAAEKQATGVQTLALPSALAPGTYMVRLQADANPARTIRLIVR